MFGKKAINPLAPILSQWQLVRRSKLQAGFTLLETLVVVTLSVMLLLTASTLFMTFLVGSSKTSSISMVKSEGDYALYQIEFLLRNAVDLLPNSFNQTCEPNMAEIVVKSIDGGVTTIKSEPDASDSNIVKIASASGGVNLFLTSGGVTISSGPVFNCILARDDASPYVNFSFSLQKGESGVDEIEDIASQSFTSGVGIRNF